MSLRTCKYLSTPQYYPCLLCSVQYLLQDKRFLIPERCFTEAVGIYTSQCTTNLNFKLNLPTPSLLRLAEVHSGGKFLLVSGKSLFLMYPIIFAS